MQEPTPPQVTAAGSQPVNAPTFYVTNMNAAVTSNDVSIIFATARPTVSVETNSPNGFSMLMPTVLIHMSLETLKDLAKVTANIVEQYEISHGKIRTDFTG